ncbi:hypothetical protein GCM10027565_21680 [Bordetella tumulicola]
MRWIASDPQAGGSDACVDVGEIPAKVRYRFSLRPSAMLIVQSGCFQGGVSIHYVSLTGST